MAYQQTNYATSPDALLEGWTDAQLEAGLECGPLSFGKLNFLFQKIFTDLKTIHDLDDFLSKITIDPDPANPGKYVMTIDMNELEDSADLTVAMTMFSEDVVNVGAGVQLFRDKTGTNLNLRSLTADAPLAVAVNGDTVKHTIDMDALATALFANVAFRTAFTNRFLAHFQQNVDSLNIADDVDINGDPTFTACP